MKVLHVLKTFFPDTYGGIEQMVHTLASHARVAGVESRVLVLTPGEARREQAPEGYEIVRYHRDLYVASTGLSLSFLRGFRKEAAWADILHMHFPWPFADLAYMMSGIRKPSLLSYHSDVVSQVTLNKLYAPLRDRYLARMPMIFAASPGIMRSSPVLRSQGDRVRMITYGIEHFPQVHADDPSVRQWQAKYGRRFFLFLGALRYYKGLHILIDALKGRDYPTVIVGRGSEELALKEQAKRLNLTNLHFLPEVTNIEKRSIMRAAYSFVLPSHVQSEAFGIVLAEAAQQGTPMITCEIGTGTSYVNQDGATGMVVPPSDAVSLGQALDTFWNNPAKVGRWGEAALVRYSDHFRAETMTNRYLEAYRELLKKS